MIDDDDIPVLTQILRTGDRRPVLAELPSPTPAGPHVSPEFDVRSLDTTSMGDPLVIGNEPHAVVIDETPTEIDDEWQRPVATAAAEPTDAPERRVNPFLSDEPRERRQHDDVSLERLASITSSVRDSVLVALQTRIDTELDARIAQAMHREVETAIAQLQDKLRDGLTEALRDVVARAVDDEMSRFVAAERDTPARLDPRKPPDRVDA